MWYLGGVRWSFLGSPAAKKIPRLGTRFSSTMSAKSKKESHYSLFFFEKVRQLYQFERKPEESGKEEIAKNLG